MGRWLSSDSGSAASPDDNDDGNLRLDGEDESESSKNNDYEEESDDMDRSPGQAKSMGFINASSHQGNSGNEDEDLKNTGSTTSSERCLEATREYYGDDYEADLDDTPDVQRELGSSISLRNWPISDSATGRGGDGDDSGESSMPGHQSIALRTGWERSKASPVLGSSIIAPQTGGNNLTVCFNGHGMEELGQDEDADTSC
jgi:hypothetical protein